MVQRSASVPTENSYGLLRIYSYYRLALALLLLGMYFVFRRALGGQDLIQSLYLGTAIPYAVVNLGALIEVLRKPRRARPRHLFFMLVLDIAALVLITHASGGIDSGFAILLMVTVAAAAIFVPGQLATLVAAVASLAVLSETLWRVVTSGAGVGTLLPTGLLGMLLFAGSIVVQRLAIRMQSSEELAIEKAGQVIELQRLNQLIVQRMRTGILFLDGLDRVRMANQAAAQMLGIDEREIVDRGGSLPKPVEEPLTLWRTDRQRSMRPVRLRQGGPLIQLAFTRIEGPSSDGTLVFAEDFSQIAQQAQQLKLASLGRLTASIAHEIRNPLGAISHAAQLLRESPQMPAEDRRLVDIVIGNAARTNEVIESVLTLSRGHQPLPQKLRLQSWLQQFMEELRGRDPLLDSNVTLEANPADLEVSVDPTHLRQVLNNLCENGLRYSLRATGTASLQLRAMSDKTTGLTYLDVVDQGDGIAEENVASIFEPFFTTESSGTGLGLYLSRELCEANQMRLEYRKDSATGGCFRLNFPHPDRRPMASLPHA